MASDAEVSLLAKWFPSVNASNAETVRKAKRIARYLGMSDAEYRKTLCRAEKENPHHRESSPREGLLLSL